MSHNAFVNVEYFDLQDTTLIETAFNNEIRHILDRINQKVAAAESLDAVMNFVFDATIEFFPCDRIGLAFLEEDGHRIVSYWNKTLYEPVFLDKGYAEDLANSSLKKILETGQRRIIHDLQEYLERHPGSRSAQLLIQEGIRSSMTCPIRVEDRIIGLFFRSSKIPYAYTPLQVQMHIAIAERLSQAIEKAYRIEQLTQALNDYNEMLGFVSHELKSPLSSIVMDCNLLLDGYLGKLKPRQSHKIERILLKCNHLLGLVRDYLDLARMESGELKLNIRHDVDFCEEVLQPCIEIASESIQRLSMELKLICPEKPVVVHCDPDQFKIVILNLLSNAVKYGYPVGEITVKTVRKPDAFIVSVQNEGPGFPESEIPKLFRKFSRLKVPELAKQEGTGLGLYTVWRIVKLHNGTIIPESRKGQWARFTITIPQSSDKEK